MRDRIAPKLVAEFLGTFAFVFIGASAAAAFFRPVERRKAARMAQDRHSLASGVPRGE
jgi:glycerol uptake facilitator-like aquaporin